MEYRYVETPIYWVPVHEKRPLWSTGTRKRQFIEYRYTKNTLNGVPVEEKCRLWITGTWKRPFIGYRYTKNALYRVPVPEKFMHWVPVHEKRPLWSTGTWKRRFITVSCTAEFHYRFKQPKIRCRTCFHHMNLTTKIFQPCRRRYVNTTFTYRIILWRRVIGGRGWGLCYVLNNEQRVSTSINITVGR